VVHRDIKPPNIMLVGGGRVKIMDFGIARMRSSDLKTQTGMMMGTPRYMSPEQVAGRAVDQRSDIFSLGTVLYELLTGTKLFSGNDATEIMYNVSQLRPVPPSRINRQVPSMLDLVVAKALEKDAGERYQDAHQFAADLRACLNELGIQRTNPDTTQRMDRRNGAAAAEGDKTEKLQAGDVDATMPAIDPGVRTRSGKPQNIIVDSNTRLAVSHIFDSSAALHRLTDPEKKDHARLISSPRPSNFLVRMWRDLEVRILVGFIFAATLAGIFVAAY
jgi:serine/threonine protein kinase